MRIEKSVTSLSWIPSEAIKGPMKAPFEAGFTHYDEVPPDEIGDIHELRRGDRFRFVNHLTAWVEVEDGAIVDAGFGEDSGGVVNSTTVKVGPAQTVFQPGVMPDLQTGPDWGAQAATFVQTTGGRTGLPAPRRVNHPPFVQWQAPLVWTTLALTITAEGESSFEVKGASKFPRHWIYGDDRQIAAKAGMADFKDWYHHAFGKHTPWGDEESPALITAAETALERQLSKTVMQGGAKPKTRKVKEGKLLTEQGAEGDELFLLLDGVLSVEVDGESLAEVGPGAILGERALLEGGARTSTLRALTPVKVAVATRAEIDREALAELAEGHRREEAR